MDKGKIFKWFLFYAMVISGVIYAIESKRYSFIPSVYIPSILITLIAFSLFEKKKIDDLYSIYVELALWLNLFGEYYFYYHWVYYDKVLHFFIPMIITVGIYNYFKIKSEHIPKEVFVFLVVVGIGAVWEILEYAQNVTFHFPSVGVFANSDLIMAPYPDTIWDMIFNCLGSFTYLFFKKN